MAGQINLEAYLNNGIKSIIYRALRASLHNLREGLFIVRYYFAFKRAQRIRHHSANKNIPPFIIASITSKCNLHCKGCYARANQSCGDFETDNQLSAQEWGRIFSEAEALGVSFILLAGGEPLGRTDVIEQAALFPNIVFPVFTNGTMLDKSIFTLFHKHRNLVPILSIEGDEAITDERRGKGIFQTLTNNMGRLHRKGVLFGVSITITSENFAQAVSAQFLEELKQKGCKAVFYVEYSTTTELAPTDAERAYLEMQLSGLRKTYRDMIFISFPGDEKASGGCLAAGRGFFHINPYGGAEPCPFSPFSDTSLKEKALSEALNSPLFYGLRSQGILLQDHIGGCVLFDRQEQVKELAGRK